MSEPEGFSVRARARSFSHAFRGFVTLVSTQHNARFHAVATLAVVALGGWLGVNAVEAAVLALAVSLVWSAEAFNTAIESLGDSVTRERNPDVGRAKDVASTAVLLAAVGAAVAGLCVLGPKLLLRLAAL